MMERCYLAATEISQLEVINPSTAAKAVSDLESLGVARLIVTDKMGSIVYDTADPNVAGVYALFPEIVQALQGNDVFSWNYQDGAMYSRAAMPIISYGTLVGCVYVMEQDPQLGSLLHSLQVNTLFITVVLELAVILFSFAFSRAFTARLRKIMASMRIIREGDYSHKVNLKGNDELAILGKEFNDLTDRLQTSENKRRQFVSDASHELKTPLSSIKLLSDSILQNDMEMDTVREFVEDIGNEADRLNRMSHKLLSLTHIESQRDSDCEITNIGPTVEKVIRMLSGIAEANHIQLCADLREDCPILILEDDLYQIIFNLAENGIKYNISGGALTLTVHRAEENAILQVSDTGVGIPAEALSHVFERFYRVDKARSRQSGGSGLGLAIVRSMVERNGGQITVASEVGVGTTFTVIFPVFDTEADT